MNKPAGSSAAKSDRASAPGIGREFSNLKEQGSATLAELQEFLIGMKGKSTKEFLGALSESGLVRATVQATLGTVLIAALFTVGPYFLGQSTTKTAAGGGSAATNASSPDASAAASPTASGGAASASTGTGGAASAAGPSATGSGAATAGTGTGKSNTPGTPQVSPENLQKAADILGVGETKNADPKSNPLDKDLDSLLDKVK